MRSKRYSLGKIVMIKIEYYQFDKIAKFIDYRGKTPKKTENGIPLITAKNIKFGYLSEEPKEFISEHDYEKWMIRGIPNKGDILFTTEAPLGNVCLLETNEKRAFAQRSIVFQAIDDTYISKYLFYYLMSPPFILELDSKKTGTTVKGIKSSILKKFKIPLPPLPEQQRVVSKLDALFEKIDKATALHVKNMEEADAFMGSVLNDIFGELEGVYEKRTLESFNKKMCSGGTPSRKENSYWENGTIEWFSSGELNQLYTLPSKEKITQNGLDNTSTKLFLKGTLLIGMYDTAAMKMSILSNDGTCNQAIVGFKPNENELNIFFTKYQLEYLKKDILEQRQGVRQQNLNLSKIKNIEIEYPPLQIQQKTVTYLDEISQKIEKIKQLQKEKLSSLKALKASILDQAFRGAL